MDAEFPLTALGDIIESPSVPVDFSRPGWIILFVFAALLLTGLLILIVRRQKRRLPLRQAVRELKNLPEQSSETPAVFSGILKSVAVRVYGAKKCAALSGQQWHAFLIDRGYPPEQGALPSPGAHYRPAGDTPHMAQSIQAAVRWVRKQRL